MKTKRSLSIENLTLASIVLAILLGYLFPGGASYFKILGDIFLRLLKMLIVPLVAVSIITAIIRVGEIGKLKNIGIKAFAYYLTTTSLSVMTGLILVNLIEPGSTSGAVHREVAHVKTSLRDIVLSFFPSNIFKSLAESRVLQVIFFSVLFAVAVMLIEERKRRILTELFESLDDVFMKMTTWVIKLTPVGVFGLVYYIAGTMGIESFARLGSYVLTVVAGLLFHAFVTLPLIGYLVGRFNPYRYMKKVREALLLAFSTASSSATLPVSLRVSEEKGGVKSEVAGLILPLGATVNMDGTALYEAVATIFIANFYGVTLSFPQMLVIFLTATLVSIGAAGIPSAGLVMMTIVLGSVGLPVEGIGLIVVVDRFLDMLRTAVNVWGDLVGARVISELDGKKG